MCQQGWQDESQLAAAELGASQGSGMKAGMERALQPVLEHKFFGLPNSLLLHMPSGVPHA